VHYIGLISLYAAFGSTLLALFYGGRASSSQPKLARRANLISILAAAASTSALAAAFLTNDFRLAYVARNSARSLPLIYKLSAVWAGQSGSLLLWLLILSLFSLAVQRSCRLRAEELDIPVNAVLGVVRLLFIILLLFVTSPFEVLPDPPHNGSGLNPMLQSLGMVVHPPLLFIGFSGFAVPFAIAVSRLWVGDSDSAWLETVRPWVLLAWVFLTAGIVTGGQWAYSELGWGGYWAWDPVENASLFPWLTGTALLHTLLPKTGIPARKWWCCALIVLSFSLTIFGTFLTRSGVLDSVHAFSGGAVGSIFLAVLAVLLVFSFGLAWLRRDCLREAGSERGSTSPIASAVLIGNILLLLLLGGVLFGTMFPLLSRTLAGREIVLDESFFNQVTVPFFLALVFLMGLAPVLAGSSGGWPGVLKQAWLPLVCGSAVGLYVTFAVGGGETAALPFGIAACGLAAHLRVLLGRQPRFSIGCTLVHIGLLVILVGVTGSSVYTDDIFVSVEPGQAVEFGSYALSYPGLTPRYGVDRYTVGTTLSLSRDGRDVGKLTSEKTFWENRSQPSTEVGIFSTFKEDLYLNLAGWEGQTAQLHLQRFALVSWIWGGAWIVYLGAAMALVGPVRAAKQGKQVKAWGRRTFS
jgi:cytochrome c-type biogenesis protein CcmF